MNQEATKVMSTHGLDWNHTAAFKIYLIQTHLAYLLSVPYVDIEFRELMKHLKLINVKKKAMNSDNYHHVNDAEPVHSWFELSYAQYLTVPRSVLQSMPVEWQQRLVACLEELDEQIDWRPKEGRYWVKLKDDRGRYVEDPLMDYQRGRRRIQ